MPYATWSELIALIPEEYATQALDDDADGTPEMWESVQANADKRCDAILRQSYTVPLSGTVPEVVTDAANLEAAFLCYARRNQTEQFPFKDRRKEAFDALRLIGQGSVPLYPVPPAASVAADVITEDSKLSTTGRLS